MLLKTTQLQINILGYREHAECLCRNKIVLLQSQAEKDNILLVYVPEILDRQSTEQSHGFQLSTFMSDVFMFYMAWEFKKAIQNPIWMNRFPEMRFA